MTIKDIFELRKQGRTEEAYEAARSIYATDRSAYASAAMFWTAIDVLRKRITENRQEEAQKIYVALKRLLTNINDKNGWMHDALNNCHDIMEKGMSEARAEHIQTGVWGEEMAVAYLREKKFIILDRNWHSSHRDIDIIAQQGNCIVFVEVKTRRNHDYADPLQAINYKKQKNLRLAINHYLHYRKTETPWRFDVITIIGTMGTSMPIIDHIEDFPIM